MLAKCKSCQGKVDENAKVCPHCGAEKPGENSVGCLRSIVGLVGFLLLILLFYKMCN